MIPLLRSVFGRTPEPCQTGKARGGITTSLQQNPGQPLRLTTHSDRPERVSDSELAVSSLREGGRAGAHRQRAPVPIAPQSKDDLRATHSRLTKIVDCVRDAGFDLGTMMSVDEFVANGGAPEGALTSRWSQFAEQPEFLWTTSIGAVCCIRRRQQSPNALRRVTTPFVSLAVVAALVAAGFVLGRRATKTPTVQPASAAPATVVTRSGVLEETRSVQVTAEWQTDRPLFNRLAGTITFAGLPQQSAEPIAAGMVLYPG